MGISSRKRADSSADIDFVVRGEFDHSVAEFAHGKPLETIAGRSPAKTARS
jgi:hypothetical protein